ncbi:amino acid ABC transporter permease [Rudaeicoccus suwonensis]|uniref:Polar amino acid transport system permease protein n=1 Tax=Rudaeicoccus suwonensis TaxID=657409 RepID=A0A561E1F9_9MICO|nr:amino acid ABC transporter permease [Rudaeicoccus suwonensis]TWE09465.1 polar amino acid transport system permease protein [Rudaeicoccus suwonensis]
MSAATTEETLTGGEERPGRIHAHGVRHPWQWVAMVVIAVLMAMLVNSFVTNDKWDWAFVYRVMDYRPVLEGLVKGTIVCTIGSMVLGVVLGVLLAVMRLSSNPVLRGVAFVYTWFFRAVPRYVLLVIFGVGLLYLYPQLQFGVPFSKELGNFVGLSDGMTFATLDVRTISSGIIVGILGLGLSEAAYMAEIARAGLLSVDKGQDEAACALGMSRGTAMRRIILPQAMRVIVPPTGNETIAMVKDTSLLSAVPVTTELFFQANAVANSTYKVMPALVAALLWYLIVCSVLMVGQSYLERYFGRGFGATGPDKSMRARFASLRSGGGGM